MHLTWFLVSCLLDFAKFRPLSLPALCPGVSSGSHSPLTPAPEPLALNRKLPRAERGKAWSLRPHSSWFSIFLFLAWPPPTWLTLSTCSFVCWRNIYLSIYQSMENHSSLEKTYSQIWCRQQIEVINSMSTGHTQPTDVLFITVFKVLKKYSWQCLKIGLFPIKPRCWNWGSWPASLHHHLGQAWGGG